MKLSYTQKTITITCEPGDRLGLDKDGYCYDWLTVRADGTTIADAARLVASLNSAKAKKSESSYYDYKKLKAEKDAMICTLMGLPKYRSKKVFVGHSY